MSVCPFPADFSGTPAPLPVISAAPRVAPVPPIAPRAAPVPPARCAQPVQVYRRRSVPAPAPDPRPPTPSPKALACYAHPVHVFEHRSTAPPPPLPTPEPSPPPPPPTRSRVEPAVYHPPDIHRNPGHIHPIVTWRVAGVFRPVTLSATEGETRISPVPSSVCDTLADPHWRHAMEEEYAALLVNQTWDLMLRPSGCNVVTGK